MQVGDHIYKMTKVKKNVFTTNKYVKNGLACTQYITQFTIIQKIHLYIFYKMSFQNFPGVKITPGKKVFPLNISCRVRVEK